MLRGEVVIGIAAEVGAVIEVIVHTGISGIEFIPADNVFGIIYGYEFSQVRPQEQGFMLCVVINAQIPFRAEFHKICVAMAL